MLPKKALGTVDELLMSTHRQEICCSNWKKWFPVNLPQWLLQFGGLKWFKWRAVVFWCGMVLRSSGKVTPHPSSVPKNASHPISRHNRWWSATVISSVSFHLHLSGVVLRWVVGIVNQWEMAHAVCPLRFILQCHRLAHGKFVTHMPQPFDWGCVFLPQALQAVHNLGQAAFFF